MRPAALGLSVDFFDGFHASRETHPPTMASIYDPERVSRLSQISTKFHAHAAVGDTVLLGIEGDKQMPAKYRSSGRPKGTITRIKNEGSENATIRVQLDGGRSVDLQPYSIDAARVWEFTDDSWKKVLARSSPETAYRGSGAKGPEDVVHLRQQLTDMTQRFDREMAEAKSFNNALVESIAQITGEIQQSNPGAKFSRVFQEEYRGMSRNRGANPFDSDMDDSDVE